MKPAFYPKPDILYQKLKTARVALIEASAGTGKTYTMEHLVVDLILKGHKVESLLVVTFTEKATRELKRRVRDKLIEIRDLKPGMGKDLDPDCCWLVDEAAKKRIHRALLDFDNAAISTIHGFCNRVLGEYAFEQGRPGNMQQVRIENVLLDWFVLFLRRHILAADHPASPLVAGYLATHPNALTWSRGSLLSTMKRVVGKQARVFPDLATLKKTLAAFRRVLPMIDLEAVERFNINARTKKTLLAAVAELKACAVRDDGSLSFIGEAAALKAEWTATTNDYLFGVKPLKFNGKAKAGQINADSDLPAWWYELLGVMEQLRPFCHLSGTITALLLPEFQGFVAAEKRRRGWFDFDDMILGVSHWVREDETFVAGLRERYSCALVDEFQDTDGEQWRIFSRVFLESPDHTLYLVGDPKQAIYRFRGADLGTYRRAKEEVSRSGGLIVSLDSNFRSSQPMVAAYNAVFELGFQFEGSYQPIQAQRADLAFADPGEPTLEWIRLDDDEEKVPSGTLTERYAQALAARFRTLLGETEGLKKLAGSGKAHGIPVQAKHCAVLVRARGDMEIVAEAFRKQGVPFAFYNQGGLFASREAAQLYHLLKAVDREMDEGALRRAAVGDFFALSLTELGESHEVPVAIVEFLAELRRIWRENRGYHRFFDLLFEGTKILERHLLDDNERAVTNYRHLADLLVAEGRFRDLGGLIEWLRRRLEGHEVDDEDLLRLETEKQAVQLMTIHASKGLEFDVVAVVPKFSSRTAPSAYFEITDASGVKHLDFAKLSVEEAEAEDEAENYRLLYVALTRASLKMILPLTAAQKAGRFNPVVDAYYLGHESLGSPWVRTYPWRVVAEGTFVPVEDSVQQILSFDVAGSLPPDRFDYAGFLRTRNRTRLTNYTRIAHHEEDRASLSLDRVRRAEDEVALVEDFDPITAEAEGVMPKGRDTGICLHELLEHVDGFFPDGTPDDFRAWTVIPATAERALSILSKYGLESYLDQALEMVWQACARPIMAGIRLADLDSGQRLHEVDFFFPVSHGLENQTADVFLNGSIDLVLNVDGRVYFADWKSDSLKDWEPKALARRVEEHYQIQVEIYAVAVMKWLGIADEETYRRRMGGVYYVFLRGLDSGNGVYHFLPSWSDVLTYAERLKEYTKP